MPEYEPPHVDAKGTIAEHHRLKMLELLKVLKVWNPRIELSSGSDSCTYDTALLNERDPQIITSLLVQIW